MAILTGSNPRATIDRLSKMLAPLNITLPDNVTAPIEPRTVASPTDAEITRAILDAKADPAADKTVQQLLTARDINRGGYIKLIEQAQGQERAEALTDALEDINTQIHERFQAAATELESLAPQLRGYESLDNLTLASLPAKVAEPARRALEAQHTARAALAAWWSLWASVGNQRRGRPNSQVLAACNPSQHEWLEHASRRPTTIPAPGDVWAMVRTGWTLDLAHNPRAAEARDEHIATTLDRARTARQMAQGKASGWGSRM